MSTLEYKIPPPRKFKTGDRVVHIHEGEAGVIISDDLVTNRGNSVYSILFKGGIRFHTEKGLAQIYYL